MIIKDNVFIITGGASGLGAATAKAIINQGGKVVLADLNKKLGNNFAKELGNNAEFILTDVTDEVSTKNCIKHATSKGTLRGLINCAGIAPSEKIITEDGSHKLGSFRKTIEINLIGTFNMMRLAAYEMSQLPADDEGERGVIINTASIAGYEGIIGQSGYASSKAALIGLTLPAARELGAHGIRVVTIAPGIMETPMLTEIMTPEVKETFRKVVPFPPRAGKASEFASLVLHALDNLYLNGTVIRMDGSTRLTGEV